MFVSVVEHFLLNYHRLYVHVHCIIYMEDRRQHARFGDFQEIQVIRLCGKHPCSELSCLLCPYKS